MFSMKGIRTVVGKVKSDERIERLKYLLNDYEKIDTVERYDLLTK